MRNVRIRLFMITTILIAAGVVMIYSASSIIAYENYGDSTYFLKRQLLYVILGAVLSAFVLSFDYAKLRKYIKPFLLFSITLLFLVLIPGIGHEISGARRWIRVGFINFQPSEIVKIAMIFYAADVLSRKQSDILDLKHGFLPLTIMLGVCLFFILLEPDLGTALAIGFLTFAMIFVAGAKLKHLGATFLSVIPAVAFLIAIKPYRIKRIFAFLNPWADPRGAGFQIIQSYIALGSGGLFGVGLGHSQQKLFYLPEAHTDFIFAIIGEEMGFLGAFAIIALFIALIYLGTYIAYKARDLFGQLLGFGLVGMIALQVVVNIAVVTGSIPTKGLPLPFISYGGSSLVVSMLSVALLLNIAKYRR